MELYQKRKMSFQNLKNNIWFPISAFAYYCINMRNPQNVIGIIAATILMVIIAAYVTAIAERYKSSASMIKIISVLSAIGACLGSAMAFYHRILTHGKVPPTIMGYSTEKLSVVYLVVGTTCSIAFVSVILCEFYKKMLVVVADIFEGISRDEKRILWIVFVILAVFSSVFILNSNAFSDASGNYDVIYTSDSNSIVGENVYLSILHGENDIRQPLFAVFAIPFLGLPYLLSVIFFFAPKSMAFFMNLPQIALLIVGYYMLAKLLKLKKRERVFFLIGILSTYTVLLFSVMMEQYIIGFFYLILFIYEKVREKESDFTYIAASGTILTSAATIVMYFERKKGWKDFGKKFLRLFLYGVSIVILAGRTDLILTSFQRLQALLAFSGDKVAFRERMMQYVSFVKSCFMAPASEIIDFGNGFVCWRLRDITQWDIAGIVFIALVIVSFVINRKDKFTQVSFAWCLFSMIILGIAGWGTNENGLILYSLYFGWAYLALIVKLGMTIVKKLKVEKIGVIVWLGMVVYLLYENLPKMILMYQFAVNYYPV